MAKDSNGKLTIKTVSLCGLFLIYLLCELDMSAFMSNGIWIEICFKLNVLGVAFRPCILLDSLTSFIWARYGYVQGTSGVGGLRSQLVFFSSSSLRIKILFLLMKEFPLVIIDSINCIVY
jgi:hypothetical protein